MEYDSSSKYYWREKYLRKHEPVLYKKIDAFSYDANIPFRQKIFNYLNNIKEPPKCKTCGVNEVTFYTKYKIYCSPKCSANDNEVKLKHIETSIIRYGTEHPFQSETIKNKRKEIYLEKYGVDNVSKNPDIIKIIKEKKIEEALVKWSIMLNKPNLKIEYLGNSLMKLYNCCNIHDSFIIKRQTLYGRVVRQGMENVCTECNKINENISNIENEIKRFVENDINIKTEKFIIKGKEIDIYLPTKRLGIEFNGLYYHSDKFKSKKYHINKTELCEKNNIKLLQVFEDDWISKKDIVKSIIKSKLNIYDNIIFANQCNIRNVNLDESKKFLNQNDINGYVKAKFNLGLYYNNELISIMIINKKRNDKEFKILRHCNKLNTEVINGTCKLMDYFINDYKPKLITILIDRKFNSNEEYLKLGFKYNKNINPTYYYFNVNSVLRKYDQTKFRKNELIKEGYKPNKTLNEIMIDKGFLKIYNCGQIEYIKTLNY